MEERTVSCKRAFRMDPEIFDVSRVKPSAIAYENVKVSYYEPEHRIADSWKARSMRQIDSSWVYGYITCLSKQTFLLLADRLKYGDWNPRNSASRVCPSRSISKPAVVRPQLQPLK